MNPLQPLLFLTSCRCVRVSNSLLKPYDGFLCLTYFKIHIPKNICINIHTDRLTHSPSEITYSNVGNMESNLHGPFSYKYCSNENEKRREVEGKKK